MKYCEIMRNTQSITKSYLGQSVNLTKWKKTERLRVCKVKKSKKRPHVTRNCVLHKVVDFAIFLGSLRISIFTLLEEIENERVYPEIYNDLAKSLYTIRKSFASGKIYIRKLNLIYYSSTSSKSSIYVSTLQYCSTQVLASSSLIGTIFSPRPYILLPTISRYFDAAFPELYKKNSPVFLR